MPPLAAIGHPPSLFLLGKIKRGFAANLSPSPSPFKDHVALDRRKAETNVTNASTHMLSLVCVDDRHAQSFAECTTIFDHFEDAEDVGSTWPADRVCGPVEHPPAAMSCEGPCLWRSSPAASLGSAWSRRRSSVMHSASTRVAVLANAVAFIARPTNLNRDVSGRADSR